MYLRRSLLLLFLLALACGPRKADRFDVFLVTVDTLRADRLGCYGNHAWSEPVSPNLDALAGEAIRFTRAFTPRGLTLPSLTSLHTGVYPLTHGVRENDQPWTPRDTLASLLRAQGYQTACFLSYLPGPGAKSVAQEFDHPEITGRGRMRPPSMMQSENDELALAHGIELVRKLGAERDRLPAFVWLHLYDVHKPYTPRAPDDARFDPDYQGPIRPGSSGYVNDPGDYPGPVTDRAAIEDRALPEADHRHVLALYDGGVRGADARIGRLLAALREAGLYDRSLVIVASDHGDELGDHHHYYYHGASVYDAVLRTVLIVRPPGGIAGAACDALVANVDVLPSVLDLLGLAPSGSCEGASFAAALRGQPFAGHDLVFGEWQDLIGIARTKQWKYILNPQGAHPTKPPYSEHPGKAFPVTCEELYDLEADPHEQQNLAHVRPEIAARMRKSYLEFRDRPGHQLEMSSQFEGNPELEQLGYIQGRRADVILHAEDCGQ